MLCKDETQVDMLRSVLAQLEFSHLVRQYDQSGVPFRTHLHVPEVHPDTKTVFFEREDEGHVLKVRHTVIVYQYSNTTRPSYY